MRGAMIQNVYYLGLLPMRHLAVGQQAANVGPVHGVWELAAGQDRHDAVAGLGARYGRYFYYYFFTRL